MINTRLAIRRLILFGIITEAVHVMCLRAMLRLVSSPPILTSQGCCCTRAASVHRPMSNCHLGRTRLLTYKMMYQCCLGIASSRASSCTTERHYSTFAAAFHINATVNPDRMLMTSRTPEATTTSGRGAYLGSRWFSAVLTLFS